MKWNIRGFSQLHILEYSLEYKGLYCGIYIPVLEYKWNMSANILKGNINNISYSLGVSASIYIYIYICMYIYMYYKQNLYSINSPLEYSLEYIDIITGIYIPPIFHWNIPGNIRGSQWNIYSRIYCRSAGIICQAQTKTPLLC